MTEHEHPRPRALEIYATGSDERDPALAAHVSACARCAEQLALLERERQALLERWPAPRFVAALAARRAAGDRRIHRRRIAIAGGVAVACAAAAIWIAPATLHPPDAPASGVRAKGLGVEIYRKRGAQVELLGGSDRVRAGDGLRVSLTLPAPLHVSLSFVDARGHVDPYPDGDRDLAAGATLFSGVTIDDPCVDLRLVIAARGGGRLERAIACE